MRSWTILAALALSIASAHAGSAEESFRAGEAAFREGDTGTAEARYREAIEADPGHIPALLRLAKVVSWHDRLEESIGIYERALALDPGNLEGRLGLALVEAWTSDFGRATEIYEGILAEHPGHREATLGLARCRAWAGDTDEARRIYDGLLAADPADTEARNGKASTLAWDGRLDEALALYQQSIEQDPGNAEALAGRARTYYWQGRAPQAWEAYGAASQASPGHREVLELKRALDDSFASSVRASAGVMVDSDDNVIDTQQVSFTFTPALSTTAALIYSRFDATQPCPRTDTSPPCDGLDPNNISLPSHANELATRLETVKGQAGWRWKPDLVLSGSAGIDRIDRERADASTIGTGSAGADWRMNDRWSFSGSLARETFAATALTLDRGIGLFAITGAAAWSPLPRLGARFTLQQTEFSDGNDRFLLAGFVRWAVPVRRPRVAVTGSSRYLAYGHPADGSENGYYSPDSYWANVAAVEVSDRIGKRIGLSAQGTIGIQRVRPDPDAGIDTDTVQGYVLRASYDIGRAVSVEAWTGSTNLALQGPTGYRSRDSGIALRWRTGWPEPAFARGAQRDSGGARP